VGFIGYDREHRERSLATIAKTRLARRSPHPSSAKRMQAIWMLVKDVAAAQKAYEAVGLAGSGRAIEDARLGARGVELKAARARSSFCSRPIPRAGPRSSSRAGARASPG